MSQNAARDFCDELQAFFGSPGCFLLAKGRVGLYVGLRALGLPPGSKVLMPGYTCVVVPSAVQYAGLRPAYVDVDPRTYNIAPALLKEAPRDVSAVVVQHTYGIPADVAAVGRWAASGNLPMIEDCCHAFGTRVDGRLCGAVGDFAFMSGQWNKPFSTGLGGMLLVNKAALAERVQRILDEEAVAPGPLKSLVLAGQLLAHDLLVRPSTAGRLMQWYRRFTRWGLAVGSSSESELKGEMPKRYLATMAECQARRGLRELRRIQENISHRKRMTAFYHAELPRLGFAPLGVPAAEDMPLLRYPLRVANKEEVLVRAVDARVEIGSWFEIPLHPAGTRMEDFGYIEGMCPEAERASREVVNLPTHLKVDQRTAEKTLDFLARHAKPA
jgi:dTDP-4-amino-4,6-dideoxygalactose transaminase